jgi:hypothetical protein
MTKKLAAVFFVSVMASPAEWIYRQYPGDKLVSFSHEPEASAEQLKQAKSALEGVTGVEKVYVKGKSIFVVKTPKLDWEQIWPAVTTIVFSADQPSGEKP